MSQHAAIVFFYFPWFYYFFMISHNERTWRTLNKPARSIYQISLFINAFFSFRLWLRSALVSLAGCIFETFIKRQVGRWAGGQRATGAAS